MAEPFLSRFTPSLMSAEALEAIFVQREPLAQRLVDLICECVSTRSSQHTLLIGPRGIGKTHMAALVYHRLRSDEQLGHRLLIAWLREEEWGVGSFLDLLIRILVALRSEHGEAGLEELNTVYDLSPAEAERRATDLLVSYLGDRSLLVIVENLDDIFAGLGSAEQRRLRAFLQEHNLISLLATSQSLFNGVSLQTSPFYGFFRLHHLSELEFQDAVRLLVQIAELTGKADLAASLQTSGGRARIRAVHHLAGGNPRLYVLFSQFLTRESLEELVSPFMRLLDDLTPYYQARMAWISPQQRKIVDFLSTRRGAVPVKDIARHCFVSPQTASGQLKTLKEAGYVSSKPVGRESYYELREPLMRICMEAKRQRGEPVKLLVEFLRLWYSRQELEISLGVAGPSGVIDREYILKALKPEAYMDDPRIKACEDDFFRFYGAGELASALGVVEELLALGGGWSEVSGLEDQRGTDAYSGQGLYLQSCVLIGLGRIEEALVSAEELVRVMPSAWPAWHVLAMAHRLRGEMSEALSAFQKAVDLDPGLDFVWIEGASILVKLGRLEEALEMVDRAKEINSGNRETWLGRGFLLSNLNRHEEAIKAFDRVLMLAADEPRAWIGRGLALEILGRENDALESFQHAAGVLRRGIREPNTLGLAIEVLMDFALLCKEETVMKEMVQTMILAAREANFVLQLGVGLVRSTLLFRALDVKRRAEVWVEAWKDAAMGEEELKVPIRLIESVQRYLATGEERTLLELPIEEMRLLVSLLKGDDGSTTSLESATAA